MKFCLTINVLVNQKIRNNTVRWKKGAKRKKGKRLIMCWRFDVLIVEKFATAVRWLEML
jgi:hypothetical protein